MGHIFRINPNKGESRSTIVDWNNANTTPYFHGLVDTINDTTTSQREITSIPSPFARIELVKEAFAKIVPDSISTLSVDEVKQMLHGTSIYHKMVSDSLDVGQIFFSYPSMKDKVDIIVWEKDKHIKQLQDSEKPAHKIVGKTLDMFFKQDSKGQDPYNFGKLKNIYILRYKGQGHRPMHIIGATSPATLFFSTANNESLLSEHLIFGTDKAFDSEYASLDQRNPEFIKYLFAFRYSVSDFNDLYPEVAAYLNAVYYVLDSELKDEIYSIQLQIENQSIDANNYIDTTYDVITFDVSSTASFQVEINGVPFHSKTAKISGNSDFEIAATKVLNEVSPLVLPNRNSNAYSDLEYYGSKFGNAFHIPAVDTNPIQSRILPGIGHQYPFLTISDFLEDKLVQIPSEFNKKDYFDGNCVNINGSGFLLPIKQDYFRYFSIEDLKGFAPSGKKTIEIKQVSSDGIEVTLRIPIQKKKEIEYKRIYNHDVLADAANNSGAIVISPEDFGVGVFPPVKFANEEDAHYRIALLSDFTVNKEMSCVCHNEKDGFFSPSYVVRNTDIEGDIRSKVYLLEGKTFDFAQVKVFTDQNCREKKATGLLVPKFKQRTGSTSFRFAIDLGTSNTHIEYTSGDGQLPEPFSFGMEHTQISMVCKPTDVLKEHIRGEFIPEELGESASCHFPMRTVLCIDKNNAGIDERGAGAYTAFGNASPAFMYNKTDTGTLYNNYIPNLKWSKLNSENEENIRCYIESLFLMIRNKVVAEGGSLSQTQITWFYPISMSNNKRGLFERVWRAAYQKYFNPTGSPIAITESIAPYSYFQSTRADVANIVTIDIGGGTTDIVVADMDEVKLVTSMRFAADAIFGNSLVAVQDGPLNGIIKQFKDEFISNLTGFTDLKTMLEKKTYNNYGNSSEVASFLFSLAENDAIRRNGAQDRVNFNDVLMTDGSQKIVFYLFFTAIMYHLANLMKAKGLAVPTNIAFSGNGSKVVSVLGATKESLELLTQTIFKRIYDDVDVSGINLIINSKNPKEATCKGGLLMKDQHINVASVKTVLLGTSNSELVSNQKYGDVKQLFDQIVKEVKAFMNFSLLYVPGEISLSNEFGIENNAIKLAASCFNKDLKTYIEKGVNLKLDSKDVTKDDVIEEPLFFYPIIGVINDLSEQICRTVISYQQ